MPYGHHSRVGRAYEYGAGVPLAGEHEAREEMFQRVRFWNNLVALEQRIRAERDALLAPFLAETPEPSPDDDKTVQRAAWAARKAARQLAFEQPAIQEAVRAMEARCHDEALAIKHASHLFWCNADDVLDAWRKARRRPEAPRFHAARLEPGKLIGRPSFKGAKGLPVAALFGENGMVRVAPVDEQAWASPIRAERRRLARTTVSVRVRSDASGDPVWLILPMVMHRPLPDAAIVRQVMVLREQIATHARWKIVLTVELPDTLPAPAAPDGQKPRVALDIGWRQVDGVLRVGAWHDDAGARGTISLDEHYCSGIRRVDDLRSIRDQHFNAARAALIAYLSQHRADDPEWLRVETRTVAQWRSPSRLAALVLRWRDRRFEGDGAIFEGLDRWRKHDKHLFEYEANLRDRLLRNRREQYRRFAAGLTLHYREVVLETFDLRRVSALKKGSAAELPPEARHQRVVAGTSVLRQAVRNACAREGVPVTEVEAALTTLTCWQCGSVERFDAATELHHQCGVCGVSWDQDDNACRVMLLRAAQIGGDSAQE